MKKVFEFALMSALVLPLVMMSCAPRNVPEDEPVVEQPKSGEEVMDDWTTPVDSVAVNLTPAALAGLWHFAFDAQIEIDSVRPNLWTEVPDTASYIPGTYLEFRHDMSFASYYYYYSELTPEAIAHGYTQGVPMVAISTGKWWIKDGKKLCMQWLNDVNVDEVEVVVMEKERLVYYEVWHWTDPDHDLLHYMGYKRVSALPELPDDPRERLTKNAWKVVSDTMRIYEHVQHEIEGGWESEEVLKETKVNQWGNSIISCKTDGVFSITNAAGEKIAVYNWKKSSDDVGPEYVMIDFTSAIKTDLLFDNWMAFYPDLWDENRAYFVSSYVDVFVNPVKVYQYRFNVEAAK